MVPDEPPKKKPEPNPKHVAILVRLTNHFAQNSIKFLTSRVVWAESSGFILNRILQRAKHPDASEALPPMLAEALVPVDVISLQEMDAADYVINSSMLVYTTSTFDTYVQDVIEFLMFLFPKTSEATIGLAEVVDAKSRSALLEKVISERVERIGHDSFDARIKWLRKKFGLAIALDAETEEVLGHYANMRNVVVHDQGAFAMTFDERGELALRQKTCTQHPKVVTRKDVYRAHHAYCRAAAALFSSVLETVLHTSENEQTSALGFYLREFEKPPSLGLSEIEQPPSPAKPAG